MNQTYTYKCPNCGAKVVYSNQAKHWKCEYCNNTYTSLYTNENEELQPIEEYTTFNYYYCKNCKNGYYTREKDTKCFRCQSKITGQKEKITGTISRSYGSVEAASILNDQFNRFRKYLPKNYFEPYTIVNTYLKSDLYSGFILITNGKNVIKYFFVNLLIPHLDTDNHKIIYDFANKGFSSIDNYEIDPKYNYPVDVTSHDMEVNNDKIMDKILEACKYSFIEQFGNNNIEVHNKLECKKGILLKTFYANFIYKGKEYKSYVIGDYNNNCVKKEDVSLNLPLSDKYDQISAKETLIRTKKKGLIYQTLGVYGLIGAIPLNIFLFILFDIIEASTESPMLATTLTTFSFYITIGIIILCGFSIIYGNSNNIKAEYLEHTINASEKDLYYNLVNNSNYVKKVIK